MLKLFSAAAAPTAEKTKAKAEQARPEEQYEKYSTSSVRALTSIELYFLLFSASRNRYGWALVVLIIVLMDSQC